MNFEKLRIYQSFVLATIRDNQSVRGWDDDLIRDLLTLVTEARDDRVKILWAGSGGNRAGIISGAIHYQLEKDVSWTTDEGCRDHVHELILVFRKAKQVALLATEGRVRSRVGLALGDNEYAGLGRLEAIDRKTLGNAFVDGPTKMLWLSEIQKSSGSRADAKAMSSDNIRQVLKPFEDQAYCMKAACSQMTIGSSLQRVGVSLAKSSIWIPGQLNWKNCVDNVAVTLDHLVNSSGRPGTPLPYLAEAKDDLAGLGSAVEAALIPPILFNPAGDAGQEESQRQLVLASQLTFEIRASVGDVIRLSVQASNQEIGEIELRLEKVRKDRVNARVLSHKGGAKVEEAINLIVNHKWLKIYFDSGRTFNGDGIYHMQFKDFPFEGFLWDDFKGIDLECEKPGDPFDPTLIGNRNSLFCWTQRNWPINTPRSGWLACDDGAMEVADFVHLSDDTVTLIHAKGASRGDAARDVSVADYEVVVSQAVKGLRLLDLSLLHKQLENNSGRGAASAVWHNGRLSSREAFLGAMAALPYSYHRQVVIVQPRITSEHVSLQNAQPGTQRDVRFRQLMTLLNAAASECKSLGGNLYVVGQRTNTQVQSGGVPLKSATTVARGRRRVK